MDKKFDVDAYVKEQTEKIEKAERANRKSFWQQTKDDINKSSKDTIFFAGVVCGFFLALFVIWIIESDKKEVDFNDLNSVPQSEYCDNYGCDIF